MGQTRRRRNCRFGLMLMVFCLTSSLVPILGQFNQVILPRSISVAAEPLKVEDATYQFELVLSEYQVIEGTPQLRTTISITKTAPGQHVRIREIIQFVSPDASSVTVRADGHRFVLDASYRELSAAAGQEREVKTTFGKMFAGGQIGIVARMAE